MVRTALPLPSCEKEDEVESRSANSRGFWDICTWIYVWLLRRVLAAVAWTRGGPSARRQAAGMDLGSSRRGPCLRHSSGSPQVSTCEFNSPPGGDSLGIRVSCEEKWVDPRIMDTKEGRGSYETDEGGDQRNHFHSGWVQALEPGIEQLHKGNHEGEGFPHTQY